MESVQSMWRTIKGLPDYTWYGILVALYLILALTLPVDPQSLKTLHATTTQYHAYLFAIILPYVLIWFAAFYAYITMRSYATKIKQASEGPAHMQIANGIMVMAWGLAVPAIISITLKAIAVKHEGLSNVVTIINNYITLLVPLIAFWFISNGTRKLSNLTKTRPSLTGMRIFAFTFILMGVYYCYLVLRARFVHGDPYHMSLAGTLLTIVVPYLFAWFTGLLAAFELVMYATKTQGLLYKRALNLLSGGIAVVIVSSIFIQYVTVIFAYKAALSLGLIFVLIYTLLALEAIGFILIANGSKRLKKIEEI